MRSILYRIAQVVVLLAVASSFAHADNFMMIRKKAAAAGGGGGGGALHTDTFTTGSPDKVLSTYDANWAAKAGVFTVYYATGYCRCSTGGNALLYAIWTGSTFHNNQYAKGTLINGGSSASTGLVIRVPSGTHGGYYLLINYGANTSAFGYITTDGEFGPIDTTLGAWSSGDVAELRAIGSNTFQVYKNGSQVGSDLTDVGSRYPTGGYAGIMAVYAGSEGLTDWEGGNVD